jgi:hypothetical protein
MLHLNLICTILSQREKKRLSVKWSSAPASEDALSAAADADLK